MDYSEIADSIAKTIADAATPLTHTQKTLLVGAVAVWIEKAAELERDKWATACPDDLMKINSILCNAVSILIQGCLQKGAGHSAIAKWDSIRGKV